VEQHDFGLELTSKERHMTCGSDATIRKVNWEENSSYLWHETPLGSPAMGTARQNCLMRN
jgi:hypothetical protein